MQGVISISLCIMVFLCYFFLFCTATKEKRVAKKEKNASDLKYLQEHYCSLVVALVKER